MKDVLNFVEEHPILSIIVLSMVIDGTVRIVEVIKN